MVWPVPLVNTGKMLELFAKVRCFTVNWRVTVEVKYRISKKFSSDWKISTVSFGSRKFYSAIICIHKRTCTRSIIFRVVQLL